MEDKLSGPRNRLYWAANDYCKALDTPSGSYVSPKDKAAYVAKRAKLLEKAALDYAMAVLKEAINKE
jgi:hypothetical protein